MTAKKNILIIIRGVADSGKTTVAALLREKIENSVKISIDSLVHMGLPNEWKIEDWKNSRSLAYEQAKLLVDYHLSKDNSVIVDEIFLKKKDVDMIACAAKDYPCDVYVVVMQIPVEDAIRRSKKRDLALKDEIRFAHNKTLRENSYSGEMVIDTSKNSPKESVEKIVQMIQSKKC